MIFNVSSDMVMFVSQVPTADYMLGIATQFLIFLKCKMYLITCKVGEWDKKKYMHV